MYNQFLFLAATHLNRQTFPAPEFYNTMDVEIPYRELTCHECKSYGDFVVCQGKGKSEVPREQRSVRAESNVKSYPIYSLVIYEIQCQDSTCHNAIFHTDPFASFQDAVKCCSLLQ